MAYDEKGSSQYGVSTQTLRDIVKGKIQSDAKLGNEAFLSEEEQLVKYLEQLSGISYDINCSQLNILAEVSHKTLEEYK